MQVVILVGPSSAGKTSLCNSLYWDHNWFTTGVDQISAQIEKELSPLLRDKLQEENLINELSPYMSKANILKLAQTGEFEFCWNGKDSVTHQFKDPDFPDIEAVLSRAEVDEANINVLAKQLRRVGEVPKNLPTPEMFDKIADDIFDNASHDGSVIIDLVPPPQEESVGNSLKQIKDKLKTRADKVGCSLDCKTVLAYCPPKALSNRIQSRNEKANQTGNLTDKREGLFPFLQLSQLITTAKANKNYNAADSLSKLQLWEIVSQHLVPEAGEEMKDQYGALATKFGLFNESPSYVEVKPREDLDVDATIDMSNSNDSRVLAEQFIEKIDSPSNDNAPKPNR